MPESLGRGIVELFDDAAPQVRLDELTPHVTLQPRHIVNWRPVVVAMVLLAMAAVAWNLAGDVAVNPLVETVDPEWEIVEFPEDASDALGLTIWTGDEIIFWGGQSDPIESVPGGEPGVAFDPDPGTWRSLPASPKEPAYWAAGVWTGDEVVICCGSSSPQSVETQTVAFDPAVDTWRVLADAPISGRQSAAVWTGSEMLVVASGGVAGFDPSADEWRQFSAPPVGPWDLNQVIWTGDELVVWSGDVERVVHPGIALDPAAGEWRVLPEPPAWPAAPDMVWTGEKLVLWGGLPAASGGSERAVGSAYDPKADSWAAMSEALPEPEPFEGNLGSQRLVWTGERVLVSTGALGTGVNPNPSDALLLAYDPNDDTWEYVGEAPVTGSAFMAGDRVVLRSDRLYMSRPGWVPRGEPISADSWPTTTTTSTTGTMPPQPTVTPLPLEERIPLQIVAVRPNNPSFAVLDFEQGTMATYPPGVHRSAQDATEGVALTSDGGLVVYGPGLGAAYLFRDGLEQEPIVFRSEVLRDVAGIASEVIAIPSSNGMSLWLFQPGFVTPNDDYSAIAELVDMSNGQHLLDPILLDPSTSAAGVTHQGLVLETGRLTDTGSGFVTEVGSERVLLLSEDGTLGEVGVGRALEAAGDTVVRLVCDQGEEPCELVISDPSGSNERSVPRPVAGNWGHLGGPGIPSVSLPLEAISPDGSSLIMSIGSDFDVNGVPGRWGLWLVDVGDLTTREIARFEGHHRLATWSRDNKWIVVVDQNDVELINVADPQQVIFLPDVIPPDHFPLAAG